MHGLSSNTKKLIATSKHVQLSESAGQTGDSMAEAAQERHDNAKDITDSGAQRMSESYADTKDKASQQAANIQEGAKVCSPPNLCSNIAVALPVSLTYQVIRLHEQRWHTSERNARTPSLSSWRYHTMPDSDCCRALMRRRARRTTRPRRAPPRRPRAPASTSRFVVNLANNMLIDWLSKLYDLLHSCMLVRHF